MVHMMEKQAESFNIHGSSKIKYLSELNELARDLTGKRTRFKRAEHELSVKRERVSHLINELHMEILGIDKQTSK